MKSKATIPKIPHALFKWYCRSDRYEELHGDLEELFYDRVDEFGHSKARFYYLLDVIRCFKPYAWKKSTTQNTTILMLNNYYKTSLRSLMKNPLSSFINIFGLAMAIGICMLVYGFATWVYNIDQHHENKDSVFLTTVFVERDGTLQQNGLTPRPLAEVLKQDFPQIKSTCRIEDRNAVIKFEDNVFHEQVRYVDPSFLSMFTFPLKWGNTEALNDANSIILSEPMAEKYFGNENPIGKDLQLIFNADFKKVFKVAGVAQPFPKAHDIRFTFLINFKNLLQVEPGYNEHDWSEFLQATFIQLDDPSNIQDIQTNMDKYKNVQNEVQADWAINGFRFEPLATLYKRSPNIQSDVSRGNGDNYSSVIFLSVIAGFLLTLACFNYINIAIVSATKRLKEIGVRKSIGATRGKVITQFLAENIMVTGFALILGVLLGTTIIIPWFEQLNDFSMDFTLLDTNLLIYLPAILLLTGVASGLYPSLYISRFQVVKILKGSVAFGHKNHLTKLFLGFQLVLACVLITSAVFFTQNSKYNALRSWGYSQNNIIYAEINGDKAYNQLKTLISQETHVENISGAEDHIGTSSSQAIINLPPNKKFDVKEIAVEANYLKTMNLHLLEGRNFNQHPGSDQNAIIVNETLVTNLKLEKPIGQTVEIDSAEYEIIGVVKNFHSQSFFHPIDPTYFKIADPVNYNYLTLKVAEGQETETYVSLRKHWSELFPELPFQGGYQEDVWGAYFNETNGHAKFWQVIAVMAVLLASLGLYGLVKLNVTRRIKEFSIRKVLGAHIGHLMGAITKQYTILFSVALVLGGIASYYLMIFVFDVAYTYHMPITISGVLIAVVLLALVLFLTIMTQIGKVIKTNPVEGLKTE